MDAYIQNKTAIDDRWHSTVTDEEIVVTMALATSYGDLYRQCMKIVTAKEPSVDLPSKAWFMLQFWPSSKTLLAMTHYMGRFKVKKMFQAWLLLKKNVTQCTRSSKKSSAALCIYSNDKC